MNKLLERTFEFIRFPELRPIPFAIIERYQDMDGERVPEKFLRELDKLPEVMKQLPLLARQQIWEMNPKSFEKTVLPLMKEYSAVNKEASTTINTAVPTDKRRKSCGPLQQLLRVVGSSARLYQTLLQLLRTHHAKKRNPQLCMLRADLVLGLHDNKSQLAQNDQVQRLARWLDASLRSNKIEHSRVQLILEVGLSSCFFSEGRRRNYLAVAACVRHLPTSPKQTNECTVPEEAGQ